MTFLLPAALAGLLALAVPLLLHLLRGEAVREEAFPALRYLLASGAPRERHRRLRELLLLALRLTLVLLLTLGAARWILPTGAGHHPPADLVLLVDNGPLSGAVVDGRRILEAQRALAERLLEELGPADRVWVLPTATTGPASAPVARPWTPEEAREALARIEPEGVPSKVEAAVERARVLLAARPPGPSRIVVIRSDGTRLGEGAATGETIASVEVDPGIPAPPNRGISHLEVNEGQPLRPGEGVEIAVRVEAWSPAPGSGVAPAEAPVADLSVRWIVDGEIRALARTNEIGEARLRLDAALAAEATGTDGFFRGRVELDPDALRLDDALDVVLPVRPPPPVRVIGEPGRWAEAALATLAEAGWIQLDGQRSDPVRGSTGPSPSQVPSLPPGSAAILTPEVSLFLPPEDPVHLAAFRAALPEEAGRRVGAPASGAWVLRPLPDLEVAGGVRVGRRYALDGVAGEGGGEPVGRLPLDDGRPWLLEGPRAPGATAAGRPGAEAPARVGEGAGGVIRILGSPLSPGWTELPVTAAMVPLLDRLLRAPGAEGGLAPLVSPVTPVPPSGPPGGRWVRAALPDRGGREATPFLAWLLFVILCVEGWLAGTRRSPPRPDPERTPRS